MRIRTLLTTSVLLATLLVLVMLFASWQISFKFKEIFDTEELAHSASSDISTLLVLTHEYALYSEVRAARQWLIHHDMIIKQLDIGQHREVAISLDAITQAKSLAVLFGQLREIASSPQDPLQLRRKQLLLDQLLTNTQILSDAIHRWGDSISAKRHVIENKFHFLALAIPLSMLLVLAILAVLLIRRVLLPLAKLHQAIVAVGKGDLTVRSATNIEDEFGELSRTFDAMAVDLVSELRKEIAERKVAETELVKMHHIQAQTAKMDAIGQLTAGVAHDFNNMLGAMMGYAELTRHVIEAGKTGDVDRYQAEILKSGNRAKELVAQMLTFSRATPDANASQAPAITLTPVLEEAISLLRASIPSSIQLKFHEEKSGLVSCIHAVNLHQIIFNLCLNARDAMSEYGKIDVTISPYHSEGQVCISCQHEFSGDYVKISVRDSGSGIPEQVLNNIFDPFFTTKGVGKGTGMGLSVVHGLVHSLKGHIQVETGIGVGSTISILLPQAAMLQASV